MVFQHTSGIWPGFDDVLRALRDFPAPKVASLHSMHFQSRETRWGLWSSEHRLLRAVLPLLDRVTVFTPSAGEAVRRAFPEHAARVSVLRHGLPVPPQLDRADARRCLAEYVGGLPGSVRPRGAARDLIDALADPGCLFVGAFGFLQHDKGFEAAYRLRDALQARAPHRRIVALVMGSLRDPNDRRNRRAVARLAADADGRGRFLVTALPPDAVFHAALRAMDLNVFWPESPTQSGRIAHALGVGATVVGRDIEGVGETLREAGAPVCADFDELVACASRLLDEPGYTQSLRAQYRRYAVAHSWERQAERHLHLADALLSERAGAAVAGAR